MTLEIMRVLLNRQFERHTCTAGLGYLFWQPSGVEVVASSSQSINSIAAAEGRVHFATTVVRSAKTYRIMICLNYVHVKTVCEAPLFW